MNPYKQAAIVLGALVAVTALLVACDYVSGMIVLIAFKQNPLAATWHTLLDAYLAISPGTRDAGRLRGSVILATLVVFVLPIGLVMALTRRKNPAIHGKARFANAADIKARGLTGNTGVILSRTGNSYLRLPGYDFVMLAAPTRSGKGVSFVIPNLLTCEDSVVVLDIKAENYNLTAPYRQQRMKQKVYRFDPFSENTHRWNPLSYVSADPNFRMNDLSALATAIYTPDPKNPFWSDSARNLFVALGLLVLETPMLAPTIGEIVRQASGKGTAVNEYLARVMRIRETSGKPLSTACIDCLNRFLNNSDETLRNILSTFGAPLAIWSNPVVDKATSADDFDLRQVRSQKMSIYLCITPNNMGVGSFILNMFFSQLINENVKELPEQNPALKHPCVLMMDEFTAMGKVAIIAKGVGFLAGYNLRLLIIIQDRMQLEATYGKEDAHTIATNMGAKIFFTPHDIQEAKAYSEMLGYETITTRNAQHTNIGMMNTGRYGLTETEHQNKKALMLPQELLQMAPTQALVACPGTPVIKALKPRYYEDPELMKRLLSVPTQAVVINGATRAVPVLPQPPASHWTFYRSSVSGSNYYLGGDFDDLEQDEDAVAIETRLATENGFDTDQDNFARNANLNAMARDWFRNAVGDGAPSHVIEGGRGK